MRIESYRYNFASVFWFRLNSREECLDIAPFLPKGMPYFTFDNGVAESMTIICLGGKYWQDQVAVVVPARTGTDA
jgi:hypothetical protein